jgi:mannose-6-phosphate isomerase-like protein (cupin superfamily)
MKELRPWGYYIILGEGKLYKSKFIHVDAGHKLSYQKHKFRSEHWLILSGFPSVTINDEKRVMLEGQSIDIKAGDLHRIEALNTPVEFIEIQTGFYFGEDDIVRLEDDYGRSE